MVIMKGTCKSAVRTTLNELRTLEQSQPRPPTSHRHQQEWTGRLGALALVEQDRLVGKVS